MRKTISILVLALFAYNAGGYYIAYMVLLRANAERVEALRRDGGGARLVRVALAAHDDEREMLLSARGEFSKDGALYDVVRTETCGDSVIAWCLRDGDEETIVAGVAEHVDGHTGDHAARTSRPALPESPVSEFPVQAPIVLSVAPRAMRAFLTAQIPLSTRSVSIPAPPPRG